MPETSSLRPARVTAEAWVRAPESPGPFKYVLVKGGDRCEADLTFAGDVDELRVWTADLSIASLWPTISATLDAEPAAPGLPDAARAWFDVG